MNALGDDDMFTVPALTTYLVKDVRIWTNTASTGVLLYATNNGGNPLGFVFDGSLSAGQLVAITCFLAMDPADTLHYSVATGGPVHFWVSGAKLPGVA